MEGPRVYSIRGAVQNSAKDQGAAQGFASPTGKAEKGGVRQKHGGFGTPEYAAWGAMIQRCTNTRHPRWKHYGGRGIAICARWRHSFAAFLSDMGCRPTSDHTLDRRDNDGNYEPSNCRWATWSEQRRNRRDAAELVA